MSGDDLVPAIMTQPDLLSKGEAWVHQCPRGCTILIQGGWAGLRAHLQVVHGHKISVTLNDDSITVNHKPEKR